MRVSFLLLLAACSPSREDLIETLDDPGEFAVGFMDTEFTYTDMLGGERTIPMAIWFPGSGGNGAVDYTVSGIVELPAPLAKEGVVPAEGQRPVLFYSHGSGGEALLAYPYAEYFAERGWIVASIGHTGNQTTDFLFNTSIAWSTNLLHRPFDISAALDTLEGDLGELTGLPDTNNTLLFGHSLGGYTTFAVGGVQLDVELMRGNCTEEAEGCESFFGSAVSVWEGGAGDPRVKAIAPQAPAIVYGMNPSSLSELSTPTLMMSGARDITTTDEANAELAWASMPKNHHWLRFANAGHMTFISICDDVGIDLITTFQPSATEDGCADSFVDISDAIDTMTHYLWAFGQVHMEGDDSWNQVLNGEPLHPDASMEGGQ